MQRTPAVLPPLAMQHLALRLMMEICSRQSPCLETESRGKLRVGSFCRD